MNLCEHCKQEITNYTTGQVMHPHCARNAVKASRRCLFCRGVIIKKLNNLTQFCSQSCNAKYRYQREKSKGKHTDQPKVAFECIICGNPTEKRRKTCSDKCFRERRKQINYNMGTSIK